LILTLYGAVFASAILLGICFHWELPQAILALSITLIVGFSVWLKLAHNREMEGGRFDYRRENNRESDWHVKIPTERVGPYKVLATPGIPILSAIANGFIVGFIDFRVWLTFLFLMVLLSFVYLLMVMKRG